MRCSTGELAKYEFVGFYIRLEDVKFYFFMFIDLFYFLFLQNKSKALVRRNTSGTTLHPAIMHCYEIFLFLSFNIFL